MNLVRTATRPQGSIMNALETITRTTKTTSSTKTISRPSVPSTPVQRERMARTALRQARASACNRTLLEMCAVQETLTDYLRRLTRLRRWLNVNLHSPATVGDLDNLLPVYFTELFNAGLSVGEGSKTLAAVLHFWPHGRHQLPRAWRAIKGWNKLAPMRTRSPMPWLALMCCIGAALHQGLVDLAVAMLLQFVCYLRPNELLSLTPECFASPSTHSRSTKCGWGLVLRPFEQGRAAKSGEFDEAVMIDRPDLPALNLFCSVLQKRAPKRSVWNFTQTEYAQHLRKLLAKSQLEHMGLDAYALRHGGASADRLDNRRSLAAVKRRGRWRADTSLRRYEKSTIVLKQVERMGTSALEYGKLVDMKLNKLLLRQMRSPRPPSCQAV